MCRFLAAGSGVCRGSVLRGLLGRSTLMHGLTGWLQSRCLGTRTGRGRAPPRLIVGGYFSQVAGVNASRIAIWNGLSWQPSGAGMTSAGHPECDTRIDGLTTWDPDGLGAPTPQPVAVGLFSEAGGLAAEDVARWDGTAWQPMGTSGAGLYSPRVVSTWDPDGAVR